MPEIPTAAAKLAAIDLVSTLVVGRAHPDIVVCALALLHNEAEQQLVEDRSIGDVLINLEDFGRLEMDRAGALVRAAVEAAGGRIEFGPADTDSDPSASRTAPGIDTRDQAPGADRVDTEWEREILRQFAASAPVDLAAVRPLVAALLAETEPVRDVYDEIRVVRTGRLAHLGPDRDLSTLVSTAVSWTRHEEGADRRADLVTAAAMLVAAIEVCDA